MSRAKGSAGYPASEAVIQAAELRKLTVDELKQKAIDLNIKTANVGWKTCCPPDGNKDAIVAAITNLSASGNMAPCQEHLYNETTRPQTKGSAAIQATELKKLTVDQLKQKAIELKIKSDNVGWKTCCPPDGNKDAIISALIKASATGREVPVQEQPCNETAKPQTKEPHKVTSRLNVAASLRSVTTNFALVIGSLVHPDPSSSDEVPGAYDGWWALGACKSDSDSISKVLEQKGFHTTQLIGYAQTKAMRLKPQKQFPIVTKSDVVQSLHAMFLRGGGMESPCFFMYFSGHGSTGHGKGKEEKGALILQRDFEDTDEVTLETTVDLVGTMADKLSFDEIVEVWRSSQPQLSRSACFVLMVDACYSGKLAKQLRDLCRTSAGKGLNMAIQSAGDARQCVWERDVQHRGVKSYNGELTSWFVAKNSAEDPSRVHYSTARGRGEQQWPQYFSSWQDEEHEQGPVLDLDDYVSGGIFFMQRWRS
eukprot:TRINITY_DN4308_c1_g1_i1.p1 TRINITY_DN4308_c1_g1~~TRINITY_DN4308_c1_g1_i1.p1  ORF type:complete len:497 (-),score=57.59 TRINITY_DN4308_c1_g1_i1:177-1619(-)